MAAQNSFTGRSRPYNCEEIRGEVHAQYVSGGTAKELATFFISEDELTVMLRARIEKLQCELIGLGVELDSAASRRRRNTDAATSLLGGGLPDGVPEQKSALQNMLDARELMETGNDRDVIL